MHVTIVDPKALPLPAEFKTYKDYIAHLRSTNWEKWRDLVYNGTIIVRTSSYDPNVKKEY